MPPKLETTTIDPSHSDIISLQWDAVQRPGLTNGTNSVVPRRTGGLTTFGEPVVSGLNGDRHCQRPFVPPTMRPPEPAAPAAGSPAPNDRQESLACAWRLCFR